jgi:NRE family putative nickel resistance protein-like MFS transporter
VKAVGYIELVRRNSNFRNLWNGQIVSLLGDWFNLIGSAALVTQLTGSGVAVGGLFVVRMLAPFLVSPLAGVLADRLNRRRLLIACDLSRACVVLGFLVVRRPAEVWLLYALTALQLGISGVFYPARNAILPDIVSGRELGAANALSGATWSVMLAIGAGLGGLVAGSWGIYPSFVVDSTSFLVSAGFITRVHYHVAPGLAGRPVGVRASLQQYADGLRYLRRNLDTFAVATLKGAMGLVISGALQVAEVTIAEQVFVIGQGGSTSIGLLYAFGGIGAGLGPILARRLVGDREAGLRGALLTGFLLAGVGLTIASSLHSLPVVLLGILTEALGTGAIWVLSTQLLLQMVPGRVRGRVFSVEFAWSTLATAIGSATAGSMLDATALGISGLLRSMAVATLVPAALWGSWLAFGARGARLAGPVGEADLPAGDTPVTYAPSSTAIDDEPPLPDDGP